MVERFLELSLEQAHSAEQTTFAVGMRNQAPLLEQHGPREDTVLQPEHWGPEMPQSTHTEV